jgi:CIC family chloride channel protein
MGTQKPRSWLRAVSVRIAESENTALIALALGVGLTTGAGVWLYREGIEWVTEHFRDQLAYQTLAPIVGAFGIVITLGLVGLIVGWIMGRFVGEERHHGVAGIMESVALSGGRLRYRRMPFKAISSVLSIGGGAAVGPEDPSVQIGSNLGSFFGQKLKLSDERVRLLVAAGAASAVAAAFRAPIAGVFFALEIILNGEFSTRSFGVVVLAAVISSAFMQSVEGIVAELGGAAYTLGTPAEIPLYALLGLLLAPVAALFIKSVYWQHDVWHRYADKLPRPLKTALAGVIVGVIAIFLPQIMGTGRDTMFEILNPSGEVQFSVLLLIVLGFAKLFASSISLAGGFVGGMFAPSLFVGLTLGSAFGRILNMIAPTAVLGDAQSYAIAGMAAVMAGVIRAPITAILLVFELTNDYRLILPIMAATVGCTFVAERIAPQGVYQLGLLRKGVKLSRGRDVDVLGEIPVRAAMTSPAPTIREEAALVELRDMLRQQRTRSLCAVDGGGKLVGIVTLSDLQRAYEQQSGEDGRRVADICTRKVISVSPEESLGVAIQRMGARDVGRLPVVAASDPTQPLGMVSRHDILRAYNEAITQKVEATYHQEQARLYHLTGAHVIESVVQKGSQVVGRTLREIDFPHECVIASVRRGDRLIVPNGATQVMAGDTLTFVAAPEAEDMIEYLTGSGQPAPDQKVDKRAKRWL